MSRPTWDLFEGVPECGVVKLLEHSVPLSLSTGEKLFGLGTVADAAFLVANGRVKLTLPLVMGEKRVDVMVGERQEGHMVGWSGLIPPYRYTVEAVAITNVDFLTLTRPSLLAAFSENPDLGFAVYANLARIVGQRLQVFQAMWIREMQHVVTGGSLYV